MTLAELLAGLATVALSCWLAPRLIAWCELQRDRQLVTPARSRHTWEENAPDAYRSTIRIAGAEYPCLSDFTMTPYKPHPYINPTLTPQTIAAQMAGPIALPWETPCTLCGVTPDHWRVSCTIVTRGNPPARHVGVLCADCDAIFRPTSTEAAP